VAQVGEPAFLQGEPEHEFREGEIAGRTPWQIFWRRLRKDRWALVGGAVVVGMLVVALVGGPLASWVTGHGVNEKFIYEMTDQFGQPKGPDLSTPVGPFVFGADRIGRDVFVRTMYGARASLFVALLATVIEVVIGVALGVAAGYFRGKADTVISRGAEVVLTLPVLLLAIGLSAACGASRAGCLGGLIKPGLLLVAMIVGLFSWPYLLRIVRGQVLSLREREFVEAARSIGASGSRVMWREILPNVLAPVIVYTTLIVPTNILFEVALTFLGVGVPASIPSWGNILESGSRSIQTTWWLWLFPGLFILATTLALNLLGDGLRDTLDPKTVRTGEAVA
jgi:peptide/nickel transport system permease protein